MEHQLELCGASRFQFSLLKYELIEILALTPEKLARVIGGKTFFMFLANRASLPFLRVVKFHFLTWSTYRYLRFLWPRWTHLGTLGPRPEVPWLFLGFFLEIVLFKHSIHHSSIAGCA